jgi:hypothetical protein
MPDGATAPIKTAIFVDFDNVYSSLIRVNKEAANKFAYDPPQWMRWFEGVTQDGRGLESKNYRTRRLLVRRCYLNPAVYGNERAAFARSGFSVIDCPSLTSQGKSSADIYMVMDIMDTLHHPTLIDEFIILSSDADFTPVLLRLREHDRRSMIISNAVAAAALKAACDTVVDQNEFVEEALGIDDGSTRPSRIAPSTTTAPSSGRAVAAPPGKELVTLSEQQRTALLDSVHDILSRAPSPIGLGGLGAAIVKQLGTTIRDNNWSGFGSLSQLLQSVEKEGKFKVIVSGSRSCVYDPARHSPPQFEELDHLSGLRSDLAHFIDRMSKSIALPRLPPNYYQIVFRAIEAAVKAGSADQLAIATQSVDQCHHEGLQLNRQTIDFIVTGLSDIGFEFSPKATHDKIELAFRDNVLNLCKNAQINLSEDELSLVDQWLLNAQRKVV